MILTISIERASDQRGTDHLVAAHPRRTDKHNAWINVTTRVKAATLPP